MMKIATALLAVASSACAFAPSSKVSSRQNVALDALKDMDGGTMPLKVFDPLGLEKLGDTPMMWFRAAELKHGRIAMVATTGFLVQASGITFPGDLYYDQSFSSLSGLNPVEQWEQVPDIGKAHIAGAILWAEVSGEVSKPHYMKGGKLPTVAFPPVGKLEIDAATLSTKRNRELNNGRLAMIAIMSFLSEHAIPGAVPVLSKIDAFHA